MSNEDVVLHFRQIMSDDPDLSQAIAAIRTLMEFIRRSTNETLAGLIFDVKKAIESLTTSDQNDCVTSIESGCELFLHFITRSRGSIDNMDFKQCKEFLIKRGEVYLENISAARINIAEQIQPFISERMTILTHSRSRVVLQVLKKAAGKNLKVYVTESRPDNSGVQMCRDLAAANIPSALILDAEVGVVMEKVNMVILGAEGVAESGGIINKVGSFNVAVIAKAMNKPVYVAVESFKFVRVYPLNQQGLPNKFKYPASGKHEHQMVDYTPPEYLRLLFTNIGILPPTAVCDELLKLYL